MLPGPFFQTRELPVRPTFHQAMIRRAFLGEWAGPSRVADPVVVKAPAFDPEHQLQRATQMHALFAHRLGMGHQRQGPSAGPDQGNLVVDLLHPGFEVFQGLKPVPMAGRDHIG